MMFRRCHLPWLLLESALFCWGAVFPVCAAEPEQVATEILETTGVRGGLIVHLGCGDGTLTAALRANERYLVHGLDRDAKQVRAAREHIRSVGDYGSTTIDRLDGDQLPYIANTVNLVVSDELQGVPMQEVLRGVGSTRSCLYQARRANGSRGESRARTTLTSGLTSCTTRRAMR